MNWYLLNLPIAAAIATAVVAPILVVMSREAAQRDDAPQAAGTGLDLALVPATPATPATTNLAGNAPARQPERVLVGVS